MSDTIKPVKSEKSKELIRSIKFTLFSISAGAIQIISFTLLDLFTNFPYWLCYFIALVLSVVYNFTINRRFTFQSAANIPIAMLKVFGYYCVFTPLSTILGDWLVEVLRWNEFLVLIISMMLNFITEFLFTRFIVYGKDVDSSKSYIEKHKDEENKKFEGPVISRKAVVIMVVCTVISVAISCFVLIYGYSPSNLLPGSWVSYYNGTKLIYEFTGDGKAIFSNEKGNKSEFEYSVDGSTVTLTSGEYSHIYYWSSKAKTFLSDHQYGEWQQLIADEANDTPGFSGYIYVDGDLLYMGSITMCKESAVDISDEVDFVGDWTGAGGDKLTFKKDGSYYYKDYGLEYNGSYELDENTGSLNLILEGDKTTVTSEQWGIEGRVLHINDQYYFYDPPTLRIRID